MNINGDAGSSAPVAPDQKSGVWGQSDTGYGVVGTSAASAGVQGESLTGIGVAGTSDANVGVYGLSERFSGVYGESRASTDAPLSPGGIGVQGLNRGEGGIGVRGDGGHSGQGVLGVSTQGTGVVGQSELVGVLGSCAGTGVGVRAESLGYGVSASGRNIGVYAQCTTSGVNNVAYLATQSLAADLYGDVFVHGHIRQLGGSFTIDHPLDPANRYLNHSSVESSEMKNVYDGVAGANSEGTATVLLPDWFEALNTDYRYQLTSIGEPAPSLHIAEEVSNGKFRIAGAAPDGKVSWQITGTRRDSWAINHRTPVESEKSTAERGSYLYPEPHATEESSIRHRRYPPIPASDPQTWVSIPPEKPR